MLVSSLLLALAAVASSIVNASPIDGTDDATTQLQATACGHTTCTGNQVCCNPTCSMCTAPGMVCTMQDCGHLEGPPVPTTTTSTGPRPPLTRTMTRPTQPNTIPEPTGRGVGVACGKNTCSGGQVCCNSSCGICTPPNGACIQLFCSGGSLPGNSDVI